MPTTATVKCQYFNLNYDGPNFSVLIDIDTGESYINKSNWTPPVLDDDLCYSQSEEFDITFNIIGSAKEYGGNYSTEISIIEE